MNFLSTHDTERAITAIAGEPCNNRDRYWQSKRYIPSGQMDAAIRRLLLGYAMIFTLPGVPLSLIHISHTFYNSLDLTCKSPFGALKVTG